MQYKKIFPQNTFSRKIIKITQKVTFFDILGKNVILEIFYGNR